MKLVCLLPQKALTDIWYADLWMNIITYSAALFRALCLSSTFPLACL